ncbi:MAG: heparinase II/III family protein [candidate division Zixibacteria bacterium]|nr:heparinase II/III family protein [candidate division Zixibacteria bacterium]
MSKVTKALRKLGAGEFRELGSRVHERLMRRHEKRHYDKQGSMFAPQSYAQLFIPRFRTQFENQATGCDLVAALRAKENNPFFVGFDQASHFGEMIRTHRPKETVTIIESADKIVANKFPILGLGYISYGDPPRWNYDPVTGKNAPKEFYGRIPYLDAAVVGDAKVIWELSRFQFVYDLGQAYLLTGDEKYACKFFDLITDWSEYHRDYEGINFCSALEFAFRNHSLCWAIYFFKGSQSLTARHAESLYRLVYLGAHFISNHLSIYFSPNTHLLGEAYELYLTGLVFPEFAEAPRWEETGLKITTTELDKQITADGMHAELSMAYHAYTLEFILSMAILAAQYGRRLPDKFTTKLESLTSVLGALRRPDGCWPHIGDEDGGRLYFLSRRPAGDYYPTLEASRLFLGQQEEATCRESFWLTGVDLTAEAPPVETTGVDVTQNITTVFSDSGLIISRSIQKQMYSLFQCGKFGFGACPHSHADMLHLDIAVGEDNFIVDPGTYIYTGDLEARNRFRAVTMHNGPAPAGIKFMGKTDPFGWRDKPDCTISRIAMGKQFAFYQAGYEHAAKGARYALQRSIFFLPDSFWLVRDTIISADPLSFTWNLVTPAKCEQSGDQVKMIGKSHKLLLSMHTQVGNDMRIVIGDALISDDYLSTRPGRSIQISTNPLTKAELLILMWPYQAENELPSGITTHFDKANSSLSFKTDEGEHHFAYNDNGIEAESTDISTDAYFAYALVAEGKCQRIIVCRGSYLSLHGEVILKSKSLIDYVDLILGNDKYQVDAAAGANLVLPTPDKLVYSSKTG